MAGAATCGCAARRSGHSFKSRSGRDAVPRVRARFSIVDAQQRVSTVGFFGGSSSSPHTAYSSGFGTASYFTAVSMISTSGSGMTISMPTVVRAGNSLVKVSR